MKGGNPHPSKHELSSLQTFAIVLAALVVLSCSVNFGACLIFLQSKGIISCDIFSWLIDKPNIENASDNTNLPLDLDLIIDPTDSQPLIGFSESHPLVDASQKRLNYKMKSSVEFTDF